MQTEMGLTINNQIKLPGLKLKLVSRPIEQGGGIWFPFGVQPPLFCLGYLLIC
jgi:hypothetical protein